MKSRQLEPPCLTCKTIISNFKLKPSSSSNFELAKLFENSAKRAWVDYEKKVFFKYLHIFNLLRICRSRKILEIGIQNLRTSCSKTGDEIFPEFPPHLPPYFGSLNLQLSSRRQKHFELEKTWQFVYIGRFEHLPNHFHLLTIVNCTNINKFCCGILSEMWWKNYYKHSINSKWFSCLLQVISYCLQLQCGLQWVLLFYKNFSELDTSY